MVDLSFAHEWQAEILASRPAILPARHFVYPREADEVERGALEVMVRPCAATIAPAQPFLATCALGFRDPAVPSGIWATPNAGEICCVAGGYAYVIDAKEPSRFTMIAYRPVFAVIAAKEDGLLLFVGNRSIVTWGRAAIAWETEKLSDEGLTITGIADGVLSGTGWEMRTDRETTFAIDLRTGKSLSA